jgi:hypothetical protein
MQSRVPHFIPLLIVCLLCFGLAACKQEAPRTPTIGEAFAGPIALNLREDVAPGSKTVATLKHGDRVEILQTRRRFVKVRTEKGVEGWTDNRQLMTPEQMKELSDFSERSATLPSQGSATVFGTLNMHAEPSRQSPSFYQIAEGLPVEVIGHRISPRVAPAPPPPPRIAKPVQPAKKKKAEKAELTIPLPPKGPSPKPPENWLELSKTRAVEEEPAPKETAVEKAPEPAAPKAMDDWSLVRTKDRKAGWVLTRMLTMTIPDDVAQYAEGHRITSYFSLGKVQDGELQKNHWLWTTSIGGAQPYEFDSFRVFIWALKRHRYETVYIQRKVKGFYPVEVKSGENPSFTLILEGDDGKLYRQAYAFEGYRVRLTGKSLLENPSEPSKAGTLTTTQAPPPAPNATVPTLEKVKGWFKQLKPGK